MTTRANGEAEGDVVEHGHVPEKSVMLENEADFALAHRERTGVFTMHDDLAAILPFEAGNDAQKSRLARPGRAEQRNELAGLDANRDVVERLIASKILADVAGFDAHVV